MRFIAPLKGLDALNQDLVSILMSLQKIMPKDLFCRQRTREGTWSQIVQKNINRFQQTRSKMKAFYFTFSCWEKKDFFLFFEILTYVFFYFIFFNSVFCLYKSSILKNEVSNERLWYLLSISAKNISEKFNKNLNDNEIEENGKGLGWEESMPKFL